MLAKIEAMSGFSGIQLIGIFLIPFVVFVLLPRLKPVQKWIARRSRS